MEIINSHEVELTATESFANARFEGMLTQGWSTHRAATRTEELFPGLDPAFYRWLRGSEQWCVPDQLSPWHEETWNFVADNLCEIAETAGFEVHRNDAQGTVTLIAGGKALAITPITNTSRGEKHGLEALAH